MAFTSIEFFLFLPLVFILYWASPANKNYRGIIVFVASYFFYGFWDWRFLGLIAFSSVSDYFLALKLYSSEKKTARKFLLITSLTVNLGLLCYFKYYNFFIESFVDAFSFFGTKLSLSSLEIILPVGISFYTFQTLSYTIDVYKKELTPVNDFIKFGAFVSFFPQLVAGPIERASNLLPQFYEEKKFNYTQAVTGLKYVLWGAFKKMVIADNCAIIVDQIFTDYEIYSGFTLFIGAVLFGLQIYGDFSGYSDMAIGIAKLFGFNLMQNFNFPYFSRDIAEFWRRWHISLTSWFRDYIYIPLGGSRGSLWNKLRNTFIVFLISGFWHGANWTFVIWGLLNALYFTPLLLLNVNRKNFNNEVGIFPKISDLFKIIMTFILVSFAWIFFRANSAHEAFDYITKIFVDLDNKQSFVNAFNSFYWDFGFSTIVIIIIFVFVEWLGKNGEFGIEKIDRKFPPYVKVAFYILITISILTFAPFEENNFIYFDF